MRSSAVMAPSRYNPRFSCALQQRVQRDRALRGEVEAGPQAGGVEPERADGLLDLLFGVRQFDLKLAHV